MEQEQPILSVTEISLSLKTCVEQVFSDIRVQGEVIGVKKAPSGHTYFSLKDSESVLSAICWRGRDAQTMNALTEGLEIVAKGKLSTYPGRSNYQMIVEKAEPAGIGALLKLLKERKEKLEKEGLFDASRKKQIPYLPEVIGVVTSPSGAVIRDIMHRLNDRFPRRVLLWPVLVQGEGAAEQITAAINGFNAIPKEGLSTKDGIIPRPDLLIVARGGGSFEDLWCFNEENVVRAAGASHIPLISAVGHETDTTLIDYAADLRAPTPTGAAEKAVPVRAEIAAYLTEMDNRLSDGLYHVMETAQNKLNMLRLIDLTDVINGFYTRLGEQEIRLNNAIGFYLKSTYSKLELASKLLDSYSYKAILNRGFSLATTQEGQVISSVQTAQKTHSFEVHFKDGQVTVSPHTPPFDTQQIAQQNPSVKKTVSKKSQTNTNQPDLFSNL